jgi:drug/metabolite transporter (DMT)-like permease
MVPGRRPDPVALLLFAACVVLGSGNFLAVRFSNLELPPLWGAGLRFALAATAFVVIAAVDRLPWPRGDLLRRTVAFGVLNFGLFFALMYWALVHVTAGVATIVLATVPLMTLLLAAAQGLERLRARAVIGAVAALVGIGWMAYAPGELTLPLLPLLALIAAGSASARASSSANASAATIPRSPTRSRWGPAPSSCSWRRGRSARHGPGPALPEARWALLYLVAFGSVGCSR